MSRITIDDLPPVQDISQEELELIFGAGPRRVRLGLEALESRELLSATVFSGLQNTPVRLDLQNGHVLMTQNSVQTDIGSGVTDLFQGKNAAGQQVAYELLNNHTLQEFTSNETWISLGAADQVSDAGGSVLFTHGGKLSLATGIPSASLGATPLLADVQSLTTTGGQATIQIGSLLTANVSASLDANSGAATLNFTNVNLDIGAFASGIVTTLQKFTKLQQVSDLATFLNKPLLPESWAASFTPLKLLQGMGYDVSSLQTFANAVTAINALSPSQSMTLQIGDFQAQASAGGALSYLNAAAPDLSGVTSYLNTLFAGVDGVTCGLGDSQQLLNLLSGANVNLFSYALNANAPSITLDTHLATIPISPETGTTLELDLLGSVTVSGGATFGFTSAGLQTGDLAKGFCIESADLSATLTVGLAGTINEACLAGFRVIGQLSGSVGAVLNGSLSSDQINADSFGAVKSPLKFQIVTQTLGPEQLLSEYLNPKAVAASAQMLADAVHDAANNAFAAVQAKNAQLLNGVDATAAHMANVLQGLYNQSAQDAASALNQLDTQAASALNHLSGDLTAEQAKIRQNLSQGADDIAGVLKGLYGQQAAQTAQILAGLNRSANEVAGALKSVYQTGAQDAANILQAAGVGIGDLTAAMKNVYSGSAWSVIYASAGNTIQDAWDAAGNEVVTTWDNAGKCVEATYVNGVETLCNTFVNGANTFRQAWSAGGKYVEMTFVNGAETLCNTFVNGANTFRQAWSAGGKYVEMTFVNGAETLCNTFVNGANTFRQAWSAGGKYVEMTFVNGAETLCNTFVNGANTFRQAWSAGGKYVEMTFVNGAETLCNTFVNGANTFRQAWSAGGKYVEMTFVNGAETLCNTFVNGANTFRQAWSAGGKYVEMTFVNGAETLCNTFVNGANTFRQAWSAGGKYVEMTFVNGAETLCNTFVNGANTFRQAWSAGGKYVEMTFVNGAETLCNTFVNGANTFRQAWSAGGKYVEMTFVNGAETLCNTFVNGANTFRQAWSAGGKYVEMTFVNGAETLCNTFVNGKQVLQQTWAAGGKYTEQAWDAAGHAISGGLAEVQKIFNI